MYHFCSHYYEQTEFPIVYIIIHYGSGRQRRGVPAFLPCQFLHYNRAVKEINMTSVAAANDVVHVLRKSISFGLAKLPLTSKS